MKNGFSFDRHGYVIDGERQFLISGEIHYFRVPQKDWEKRIRLLVEAGANAVATYVPWCIHEPREGEILFSGSEERELPKFLELAQKYGLKVLLRPGPYQYSELTFDGLPEWLYRDYPETHARKRDGSEFDAPTFSYIAPVFLEKVKQYYRGFCEAVKPYFLQNGGPVVMIQLDNELTGVHLWRGSVDYHPAMGIGQAGGRYPSFLRRKYGSVEAVSDAYGTVYASFEEVDPNQPPAKTLQKQRMERDYFDFYCETGTEYLEILQGYLCECGVKIATCHNPAGTSMIPVFKDCNQRLGKDFLLSVDFYYVLTYGSGQFSPTPKYVAENMAFSADLLEGLGNPFSILEMQAGTFTQVPPVLPEDLEAFYMANLAMGVKGVNYYVFTGGKNSGAFGTTANVYDYRACVSADGKKRPNYQVIKRFSHLLRENPWLVAADRVGAVRVGVEMQSLRDGRSKLGRDQNLRAEIVQCIGYTLMTSRYPAIYTQIDQPIPTDKPLILYRSHSLSRAAQENIIEFVNGGGKLLLIGGIATLDENYRPCTLLADFIGIKTEKNDSFSPITRVHGRDIYSINHAQKITAYEKGDQPIAHDGTEQNVYGITGTRGKGRFIYFGGTWLMTGFDQTAMLEDFLSELGAKAVLSCSNPCVNYTVRRDENGKTAIFLMNLYAGRQSTEVTVWENGEARSLGKFALKPMQVKMLILPTETDV